jgi:hypothetical protein
LLVPALARADRRLISPSTREIRMRPRFAFVTVKKNDITRFSLTFM